MQQLGVVPGPHREFLEKIELLQSDERIVGVAAGGSFIGNSLDEFSDLDLVVAVEPTDYSNVMHDRHSIAAMLGERWGGGDLEARESSRLFTARGGRFQRTGRAIVRRHVVRLHRSRASDGMRPAPDERSSSPMAVTNTQQLVAHELGAWIAGHQIDRPLIAERQARRLEPGDGLGLIAEYLGCFCDGADDAHDAIGGGRIQSLTWRAFVPFSRSAAQAENACTLRSRPIGPKRCRFRDGTDTPLPLMSY